MATTLLASTAACNIIPAPYRVELYQTKWVVDALDGEPLHSGTTMSFNEGGVDGVVAVRTPCGRTQLEQGGDSDGDLIEFYDPRLLEALDCSVDQHAPDEELFAALDTVEAWRVRDDDHITLIGTREIALTRQP